MIDKINEILKQLEASLRGKKFNDNFLEDSKTIFAWAYSCFLGKTDGCEINKELLIEKAVMMHNRAKTITNSRFSECITLLKSAAAWILSTYAERNTKFTILFIRLHCRIASEWIQLQNIENATNSYNEAMTSWKQLNISALERLLPQVELETLQKTVFYGYLDLSKLLQVNKNCDWSSIRACVGGALEILPQSPSLRIAMAQHVLELAHHLATLRHVEDSIHYFHVILTILDVPLSPSVGNNTHQLQHEEHNEMSKETWRREVLLINIKTFLGLGYLHKELNQCDKASNFIVQAQQLNTELSVLTAQSSSPVVLASETFTFAAFSIQCRANNAAEAESLLNILLQQTNSFDLALSSVRIFLEGCGGDNECGFDADADADAHAEVDKDGGSICSSNIRKVTDIGLRKYRDLFAKLEAKFPSDPDHTSIRLIHLKFALSFSNLFMRLSEPKFPAKRKRNASGLDEDSHHATELCKAIIYDHTVEKHIMTNEQIHTLIFVLQERVHWQQSQHQHKAVMSTCDLLMTLLMATSSSSDKMIRPVAFESISSTSSSGEEEKTSAGATTSTADSMASTLDKTGTAMTLPQTMIEDDPAVPNLKATTLVVMQWKSDACLHRMIQLLNQNSVSGGAESVSHTEDNTEIGEKDETETVPGLAKQCICIALKCALSHHCTKTVLLAFHAVMRADQHCDSTASWKQLLSTPAHPLTASSPADPPAHRSGVCQATEMVLQLLVQQQHNVNNTVQANNTDETPISSNDTVIDTSICSAESEDEFGYDEVCGSGTTLKYLKPVQFMMLKQLHLCCQLAKEADEVKDDKGVAMLRLQQAWLSFYQRCNLPIARQIADTPEIRQPSLPDESNSLASSLSAYSSPSYLTVLCEMAELFLKTYVRCTCTTKSLDPVPLSSTATPLEFDETLKRNNEINLDSGSDALCSDHSQESKRKQTAKSYLERVKSYAQSNQECDHKKKTQWVIDESKESIFSCVPVLINLTEGLTSQQDSVASDSSAVKGEYESRSDLKYHFRCSAFSLQSSLLPFIKYFSTMTSSSCRVTKVGIELECDAFGNPKEVLWLADFLWNIGVLLMKKHMCTLPSSTANSCFSSFEFLDFTSPVHAEVYPPLRPPPLPQHFAYTTPRVINIEKGIHENCDTDDHNHWNDDLSRYKAGAEVLELCQQMYNLVAQWQVAFPNKVQVQNHQREQIEVEEDGIKQREGTNQKEEESVMVGLLSNQCRAALSAIAVRLDINCLFVSAETIDHFLPCPSTSVTEKTTQDEATFLTANPAPTFNKTREDTISAHKQITTNITLLRRNLCTVEKLLPKLFDHGLTKKHPFHKLYLMLALAARLMLEDTNWDSEEEEDNKPQTVNGLSSKSPAEKFVESQSSSLLVLTPLDLIKCADLALCPEAIEGSEVVARSVLRLAVQLLVRDDHSTSSYALLGNLYRRLVDISPDKNDALHLLEEFEQLIYSVTPQRLPLLSVATTAHVGNDHDKPMYDKSSHDVEEDKEEGNEGGCPFLASDVDCIVTKAFNLSILLIELDHTELAERFVSKAMNLLCFTSPTFAPWKDMIRDMYFYVLKKKADVQTGNRALFLQQPPPPSSSPETVTIIDSSQEKSKSSAHQAPASVEDTVTMAGATAPESAAAPQIVVSTASVATLSTVTQTTTTTTTSMACNSTLDKFGDIGTKNLLASEAESSTSASAVQFIPPPSASAPSLPPDVTLFVPKAASTAAGGSKSVAHTHPPLSQE